MKSFLPLFHLFLVLTLIAPAAFIGEPVQAADARPVVQAGDAPSHAPDRILIKFASGVAPRSTIQGALATDHASLDGLLSAYHVQAAHRLFKSAPESDPVGLAQIHVLRLKPGTDLDTLLALLETDPNVEWAEPDYLAFPAATTPNDPLFTDQWGLAKIQAPAAWDVTTGSATIPIAIVDSGIDFSHPDLSGKLWVNPGEIAGNGLDDDNNGYVDDVQGWDLVNADNAPADDNGHGTQVAGIAAASTNNGAGIAGVCWACRIMPVKVMQASGVANYSDIAAGVLYAAQKGARVINLSLGGYSYSSALDAAIQAASGTYGAVIVAGAGNDNLGTPFYPAAYPEVLAVAGTDPADAKAALSNYGAWLDVSAPAVGIKTTFMGGDYGDVDGTSYAAPFVAGVAGLLRSQNPDWSPDMVRAQVIHTADDIDPLNLGLEGQLGSGRVNALAAVTQTPSPIVEIAATAINGDPLGRPAPGESATLQITLSNDWLDAVGTVGTLTTSDPNVTMSQGSATFGTIVAGATATGDPVYAFTVSTSAGYNHSIPLNLHVTANGGAYAVTLPLTITTASANQNFCGTIDSNQTWTSDKTYIITCNAGIAPGYTLTIQPGTVVKFDGNYNLNVGGALIADGTEEQPIRFMSDTGSPWGRIYFDDSSIDATADASGTYQTGNLLRWVIVEDAAQGIGCNSATPYLDHTTVTGGGVNCPLGATPVWILDSTLVGGMTITGSGRIWRTAVTGGNLTLSGQATVSDNVVSGGITVGDGSLVQNNTAGGTINAPGASTVQNNIVSDGGISAGSGATVQGNQVSGGNLQAGSAATILSNTVSGGGISAQTSSTVQGNNVEGAPGWGISTSGSITAQENRAVGNANGIQMSGGLAQGNLIANSTGVGLQVSGGTIISNTLTGNQGNAIVITSGAPAIHGNNLEFNTCEYDVVNNTANPIDASGNWWGTTNSAAIDEHIFDFYNDYNKGIVQFEPLLAGPAQDAPAYIRSITLTPESPVGIETVAFEVEFSRPMNPSDVPQLSFQLVIDNTWTVYNISNSGLPNNEVEAIAVGPDGSHWFGTWNGAAHFDGATWTVYNSSNSGLPDNNVWAIATDPDGSHWFGTLHGTAHFNGATWTVYDKNNSGLRNDEVGAITVDPDGSHWFGTFNGAAHFDGVTWTVYDKNNSGLPDGPVTAIATDPDGSHWFGTFDGAAHFGATWTVYDKNNSGLPQNGVMAIATDPDGSHWFGTGGGVAHFNDVTWTVYDTSNVGAIAVDPDGSHWFGTLGGGTAHFDGVNWTIHNTANSGLPSDDVWAIATDPDGSHWFGTGGGGAAVLWNKPLHPIENNPQWLDDHTYRSTYDITSLIERGEYWVHVSGAVGTDGLEIAPMVGYPFTVDYAGAIGDTSPPPVPAVEACASTTVGTLSASWSAHDPDSVITLYSYAIGATPGGGEVVNWTNTTAASFTRTGLGLIAGHTYYISVKARNEGGLWSEAGTPAGLVAGSGTCTTNNTAPVADAGADQNVTVNALVTLDGSGSYDPDGHLLPAYSWQQTGGPTVILNGSTTDHPTFTAPAEPATLIFALSVTDEYGLPDPTPDEVMVTVSVPDKWFVHLPVVIRNR